MIRKVCELSDIKMSDEGNGYLLGYASTWNNLDRAGDTFTKGAFKKTLESFIKEGFAPEGHNWTSLGAGMIADAYEDDLGLAIKIAFYSTPDSQIVRQKCMERIAAGKMVGLSIGFDVRPGGYKSIPTGRNFIDVELFECSIVTVPCNPKAQAVEVKGLDPEATPTRYLKADYLGDYAEENMVLSAIGSLLSDLMWNCVYPCLFDEDLPATDRNATLEGAFAEFSQLALSVLTTFITDDASEDQDEMKAQFRSLFPPISKDSDPAPAGGTPFESRLLTLLADAEDCVNRANEIQSLRAQKGRSLSLERRAQFSRLHEQIGALLEATRPQGDLVRKRRAKLALLQRKAALTMGAVGDDHDDRIGEQPAPQGGAGS